MIVVSDPRLDPEEKPQVPVKDGGEGRGAWAFCRRHAGPQAHQLPGVTSQDATTFPGFRKEKMCPWKYDKVFAVLPFLFVQLFYVLKSF